MKAISPEESYPKNPDHGKAVEVLPMLFGGNSTVKKYCKECDCWSNSFSVDHSECDDVDNGDEIGGPSLGRGTKLLSLFSYPPEAIDYLENGNDVFGKVDSEVNKGDALYITGELKIDVPMVAGGIIESLDNMNGGDIALIRGGNRFTAEKYTWKGEAEDLGL